MQARDFEEPAWRTGLETIIETIPDGVVVIDRSGRISFANRAAEIVLGLSRREIYARRYNAPEWKVMTVEGRLLRGGELPFDRVMRDGKPIYEVELAFERPDGKRVILSVNAVPMRDTKGNIIGVAHSFSDITQRKMAELALRESKQRLQKLLAEFRESRRQVLDILESITDGFFALDNDWRFTYLNHKAAQLIGKRREELLFRNMWEAVPETVGTKFDTEYHRTKEEMVPTTFEVFYPPLAKWFEVHAYPFETGLSVYVSDITERKKIEEALKESESRYRILFEESPIALWEQDASGITAYIDRLKGQGVKDFRAYFEENPGITAAMLSTIKIIDVNKAVLGLYGFSSKEEFIANFETTFTKDGLDASKEFLISYAERGESKFEAEFTSRTFQGEMLYVHVISFVPPGYEETRSKIFIATIDITERKKAEELSNTLDRINMTIAATFDTDEIINTVVNESVKTIGAEEAGFILRVDNYWVYKYLFRAPEEFAGARLTGEETEFAVMVAQSKRPVVSNDAFSDERFDPEYMRKINVRSFLALPLVLHGNVIGILYYANHSKAIQFTASQVNFAGKLSTLASFALENAHLYTLKKDIADTLQETLLTVPEHVEGIEFSHLYRPATEVARVGGDFYDMFSLKEGKVGISVGDISGTGVQAAILASMVKNAIRAYAYDGSSPAQVMAKTNELVRGTTGPGLFVSAFFGVLDTATGLLIYCSAGHPPAILKRNMSEIALLITSSPILGAFSALNFIDDEMTLRPGDIAVLYTDGVTEARCRNGKFFGEEQLVRLVRSMPASISIKDIPKVIYEAVTECTGGIISDDLVVISFKLAQR